MSDKTKDRPYMGMGVLSGGDLAGTTIVGGQPSETRRGARQRVPVGLERILFAAAADPEFKAALLADREAALAGRDFELTDSERSVLQNLPGAQLAAMIERLDVSRENLVRREFLRNVAGTFVALAAGTALAGCPDNGAQTGAPGDAPFLGPSEKIQDVSTPPQPPPPEPAPPAGIRPDVPEPPPPKVDIDPPDHGAKGGIRPDEPPPAVDIEPPPPPATRGIRPD